MDKRRIWIFICALEILLLGGALNFVVSDMRNSTSIDVSIKDWKSWYIEYNDGWYVNEDILQVDKPTTIIYGPAIKLPKGTYSVQIQYECDFNQSCKADTASGEESFLKAGTAILSKNKSEIIYEVTATEDIESFLIEVQYNGKGMLGIRDIAISKNSMGSRKVFFNILLFSCVINVCFYYFERILENKNLIAALGSIVIISSLPLMVGGIGNGHDLPFHLVRIEAIADGIHFGELCIPVRLSNLWYEGYGYPTSVYYGDLLLYIPAACRLMGYTVTEAYKIYVFLINAGTVVISYKCFKKIFLNKNIAVLTCMAYATATYRMTDVYVRAAVGEYSAMLFFPLIALAMFRIYTDKCTAKGYRKNALLLALGMTGLIETHIISTEIAVVVIGLICIILWKKTFRKNTLLVYFYAVIGTLVLNLSFIMPFLDYYVNVPVNIFEKRIATIQESGTYIAQLFSFFANVCGANSVYVNSRMSLTPGIVLMSVLAFAVFLLINKKSNTEILFFTVLSSLMLYIATNIFPWDYIARHSNIGNMLAQIEFPWRYLGAAVIFLTLLFGSIMKLFLAEKSKGTVDKILRWTAIACMMMACWFTGSYYDGAGVGYFYGTSELDFNYYGMEYLRVGSELDGLTYKIVSKNMDEVTLLTRNGHCMELYCIGTNREGNVEVPIFNYKGYHVYDEYGTEYNITDGENNVIRFSLPPSFSGKVTVDFQEPWYWRVAELISLVSAIMMFFMWRKEKHVCGQIV